MTIIKFLQSRKIDEKSKSYRGTFFDGQISLILLTSSSIFLFLMILIILLNGFLLNFDNNIESKYIKWYYYTILFDIFLLSIILAVNVILLNQINKSSNILRGNEDGPNVFRYLFLSSLITIIILEFLLWVSVKNIANSDLLFLVIALIFIGCWVVFFIFIKAFINVSKENMKNLIAILFLIIILSPVIIIVLQNVLFIMDYNDLSYAYAYSFSWTLPFIFGSMLIGIIELIGIHKQVIHKFGNEKLFFKPSTDFFLLISLPLLYLPCIALNEYYPLYEYYFDKITRVIHLSFMMILLFLILFFVTRKFNEKRYYKDKIKNKSLIKDIIKDKKAISLFFTYLIIILIITSFIQFYFVPTYEKDISRKFSDQYEYNILTKSENLNYGSYWNISLFNDRSNNHNDLPSYSDYVWINFINSTTIDFYSEKIDYLKNNNIKTRAYFKYYGKVFPYGTYHIDFNRNYSKYNLKISSNENKILEKELSFQYVYTEDLKYPSNQNDENKLDSLKNYYYSFNNTYLVYMEFYYSEYYEPLVGFGNDNFQIVVIDEELNLKLIIVEKPEHWIS